jgi:hypothetical protein
VLENVLKGKISSTYERGFVSTGRRKKRYIFSGNVPTELNGSVMGEDLMSAGSLMDMEPLITWPVFKSRVNVPEIATVDAHGLLVQTSVAVTWKVPNTSPLAGSPEFVT